MSLDAGLVARMDENLAAYWGGYAMVEGATRRVFPGALQFCTPIPLSLFNTVTLSAPDLKTIDTALVSARACIAAHATPVEWRISAGAATDAVRRKLEDAGLASIGSHPAMLADLSAMPDAARIEGLTIVPAADRTARRNWGWLTSHAFELSDDIHAAMRDCEAAIPAHVFPDQPRFTGLIDGQPVAVSSTVMAGGLAGVYAVAVVPAFRGRGIGTAMTLHAMAEGRRRGATTAVLQATEMGKPVYEKIGFSTAFAYELFEQAA